MALLAQSRYMYNQVHSEVLRSNNEADAFGAFKAIETNDGHSVLFCIDPCGKFRAVQQQSHHKSGWLSINLTSVIVERSKDKTAQVTDFAISQNTNTKNFTFDLVVVVQTKKSGDKDHLLMSMDNPSTPEFWTKAQFQWKYVAYDGDISRSNKKIKKVHLPHFDKDETDKNHTRRVCLVDIQVDEEVKRFLVNPEVFPNWEEHPLVGNYHHDKYLSCGANVPAPVGKAAVGPGLYDCGYHKEGDFIHMGYTTLVNKFAPTSSVPGSIQLIPGEAESLGAVASAQNQEGHTLLFTTCEKGIFMYRPEGQVADQESDRAPKLIIDSPTFVNYKIFEHDKINESKLMAAVVQSRTVLWYVNGDKELFYFSCLEGQEDKPEQWSKPVPILSGVRNFTFYVDKELASIVVFAELDDGEGRSEIVNLKQDRHTKTWMKNHITMSASSYGVYHEGLTFTTHITQDHKGPGSIVSQKYAIRPTRPMSAYINGKFHLLSPNTDTSITPGPEDTLSIVEHVDSVTATSFTVTDENSKTVTVDPLHKGFEKVKETDSWEKLRNTKVPGKDGIEKPLVPEDVSDEMLKATVDTFSKLMKAKEDLPSDGSVLNLPRTLHEKLYTNRKGGRKYDWGPTFDSPDFQYKRERYLDLANDADLFDIHKVHAGDLMQHLKTAAHKVTHFACEEVDKVYHLSVNFVDTTYRAALDSLPAITGALDFVFNKVKMAVEDVVSWVGFLFNWESIIRTHTAMKNIITVFANHSIEMLASMEPKIDDAFKIIERDLDKWAGIEDPKQQLSKIGPQPHADEPHVHWGSQHFRNSFASTDIHGLSFEDVAPSKELNEQIGTFEQLAKNEDEFLKDAMHQLKVRLIDEMGKLTIVEAMKIFLSVFGKFITRSLRQGLITVVNLAKIMAERLWSFMQKEFKIPIISPLYKKIAKAPLTILDALCLLGAIPGTIIYKLTTNTEPFPDGPWYKELVDVHNLSALATVLNSPVKTAENSLTGADIVSGVWCFFNVGVISVTTIARAQLDLYNLFPPGLPAEFELTVLARLAQYLVPGGILISTTYGLVFDLASGSTAWYSEFRRSVDFLSILNACVVQASMGEGAQWAKRLAPLTNCVLAIGQMIPSIAALAENPSHHHSFRLMADFLPALCSGLPGSIAPGTTNAIKDSDPDVWAACKATQYLLWGFGAVVANPMDGIAILAGAKLANDDEQIIKHEHKHGNHTQSHLYSHKRLL